MMDNEMELLDGPAADAAAGDTSARDLEAAERRLNALVAATTDVVSGEPVPIVLERIAGLAEAAMHAAEHLLAVSLPDGTRHVSSRGAGTSLAAALGTRTSLDDTHPSLAGRRVITAPVAMREQGKTAQLLLDVACSLNERSTVEAVSQSVADAIPALGMRRL